MNSFEKGNKEEKKLVREHWVRDGKKKKCTQKQNLNVFFVSISKLMNICDLENGETQTETKDLLKEASVRQRGPTRLFKNPSN